MVAEPNTQYGADVFEAYVKIKDVPEIVLVVFVNDIYSLVDSLADFMYLQTRRIYHDSVFRILIIH